MIVQSCSYCLFVECCTLGLVLGNRSTSTADLETLVLGFLDSLSRLFFLFGKSLAHLSVQRLELAQRFLIVVNQAKSSGLSTTKFSSETKQDGQFRIGFVHAANNVGKLLLGDIGSTRMKHIDDELQLQRTCVRNICIKVTYNASLLLLTNNEPVNSIIV